VLEVDAVGGLPLQLGVAEPVPLLEDEGFTITTSSSLGLPPSSVSLVYIALIMGRNRSQSTIWLILASLSPSLATFL